MTDAMLPRPTTWLKVTLVVSSICAAGCGRFGFELLAGTPREPEPQDTSPISMGDGDPADLDGGSIFPPGSDATIPCDDALERLWPSSCGSSVPRTECERALDADAQTRFSVACERHPEACDFQSAGCTETGCIRDLTLRLSLPQARRLERLRFRSDWWEKRPSTYELWVSSTEAMGPDSGATLVSAALAQRAPWVCQAGESCAPDYVPDHCCPAGRDAPQAPPTEFESLWDDLEIPAVDGRVWWLRVRDTSDKNQLSIFEIELYSAQSCR